MIFRWTRALNVIAAAFALACSPANAATFYSVSNPFMQIFNLSGTGLNTGQVYFGVAGQDPITHPITAYWDLGGTIPATQPIPTSGGYLYRSGTPAGIYLASANPSYSIKVIDKNGAIVYYQANVTPQPLSPITSAGDLIIGDGPYSETRLPIGPKYSQLTSNGTTATWLGPVVVNIACTNTSADQVAVDAALTTLKAANGGTIQLSPGTCLFDGAVTTTGTGEQQRVNFVGTGEYGATNVQATGRANYVFTVGDLSSVSNLRIKGTSTNLGGIQITTSSTVLLKDINITGFSGAAAWAIDVDGTSGNGALRSLVDHVYLYNNSHGLRLRGVVNDFKFNNSTISISNSDLGSMIDAEGGSSVDAYFNNIDLASAQTASPIKCTTSGQMTFDKGGFEDLAIGANLGDTVANAKVFDIGPTCSVKVLNITWTGFDTARYTYTGTPTFFYAGADPVSIDIANVTAIQSENPGAVAIRFFYQSGVNTRVSVRNNRIRCVGCTSHAQNQAIITNGINVDFGTKFGDIINNVAVSNYSTTVWGLRQELGTFSAAQTANAGSGANTVLDTVTLPTNSFWKGRSLVWSGCGKSTGTAGTHTIDFKFDAGGATSYNVNTTAAAEDWCSRVTVYFNNFTTQSVNVNGVTGTTPINSVTAAAKATDVNAPVFSILGTAAGGDTITLTSSSWMEN